MSMETYSLKRNRVYKRKFDHDEARRLRIVEGWTWQALSDHFGVTIEAVRRVCDRTYRERNAQYVQKRSMSGTCSACGGPMTRHHSGGKKYDKSNLCRACWAESKQNRFRFDELGQLAAIRCTTCKQWKDADLFPRNRSYSRGKHSQCRECGTKARRAYRERTKVPCVRCGVPALPPSEKGSRGGSVPRCRACSYEDMRHRRLTDDAL